MGREQCDAIHLHLMVDRCKALIRGGVRVLELVEHFTPDEYKHLKGMLGPAVTPDSYGDVWAVKADHPKFQIYAIRAFRKTVNGIFYDHSTAIRCKTCGRTSHNPNDVTGLYCGNCHAFHCDGGGIGVGGSIKIEAMVTDAIEKQRGGEQARWDAGLERMAGAVLSGDKEVEDWRYRPEDPKKFRHRIEQAHAELKPRPDETPAPNHVEAADGALFEKDTIEALLERHPQTCFPSPLALAVQRFGSTQEPTQ